MNFGSCDQLALAHVVDCHETILEPRGEDDVALLAIGEEVYLANGALVDVSHLFDCFSSVNVPDCHRTTSVSRDNQAVGPCELNDRILVSVEQALGTLERI